MAEVPASLSDGPSEAGDDVIAHALVPVRRGQGEMLTPVRDRIPPVQPKSGPSSRASSSRFTRPSAVSISPVTPAADNIFEGSDGASVEGIDGLQIGAADTVSDDPCGGCYRIPGVDFDFFVEGFADGPHSFYDGWV